MTTTAMKERMMDDVIRRFGLENYTSIAFCRFCENENNTIGAVQTEYQRLMMVANMRRR